MSALPVLLPDVLTIGIAFVIGRVVAVAIAFIEALAVKVLVVVLAAIRAVVAIGGVAVGAVVLVRTERMPPLQVFSTYMHSIAISVLVREVRFRTCGRYVRRRRIARRPIVVVIVVSGRTSQGRCHTIAPIV